MIANSYFLIFLLLGAPAKYIKDRLAEQAKSCYQKIYCRDDDGLVKSSEKGRSATVMPLQ